MSRSISVVLFSLALCSTAAAQSAPTPPAKPANGLAVAQLDASKPLPAGVKAEGKMVEQVWRWTERDGKNTGLAVFSSTEKRRGGRLTDRSLFVQLYRSEAGALKQLRLVKDWVNGCEFDLTARFVPGSVTVTDVDADGTPELTFAYDLACRSDVSPATRKLLLLEGEAKHALRGKERVVAGVGQLEGGEYEADGFAGEGQLKSFAVARWDELLGTGSF